MKQLTASGGEVEKRNSHQSYFLHLSHPANAFTGNMIIAGQTIPASLKKIGPDIFLAHFRSAVALNFLQPLVLRKNNLTLLPLLPALSDYNQRKLQKIAKDLHTASEQSPQQMILHLLAIERFLEMDSLWDFFSLTPAKGLALLIDMELRQDVKIVDFSHPTITSYQNYRDSLQELGAILNRYYESRQQTISMSEIEKKIQIPAHSLFLRYLLRTQPATVTLRLENQSVVLQSIPLSEEEKDKLEQMEALLKKHKLPIFSIESMLKISQLPYKQVNDALWYLLNEGKIVQLNENHFMFAEDLQKTINKLKKYKRNQEEMIDIASFRDLTGWNRKHILVLLQYLDTRQITLRLGDKRKILLPV